MSKNGPIVAICRTRQEAADAATELHQAGFDMRKISIVANDDPPREGAAKITCGHALGSAWVTLGCLNVIGAGLEFFGIPEDDICRCTAVLNANRILIVMQGTPEHVVRARLACRGRRRRSSVS